MKKILITSALPYANGPLHFGHIAGAYLPGDCYARFQRLMGNDVLYICGSDEYGVAIAMSAEMAGRTPQEHADLFHAVNKELFDKLNFSFDHFSRTTWSQHKEVTQQYFLDLLSNGYIEERVTDQLYSEKDKKFLADRYVVGVCPKCGFDNARGDECQKCGASYEATDLKNPRSKLTGAPLARKPTKHWFLLLDKFKDKLTDWLSRKQWKPNVVNFVKGYIDHLHPRAITRDSNWGIPVPLPNTEGKVLYVWFDAPVGYISATQEWAQLQEDPNRWEKYWLDPDTQLVQFIGKDNIPFHATIFPAMTMGQNQPYKLVDELPANEFYNLEGRRFSKSDGWYIDLQAFFNRYTADQIRYCLAASAPETADSEFTWKDFQNRCNGDLLGKFGNFVNRTLVFVQKNCGGTVPSWQLQEEDKAFLGKIKELCDQAKQAYGQFKLRHASATIMELAQLGNVYFDKMQPWKGVKQLADKPRMNTVISCCLECVKALAVVASPIIPEAAQKMMKLLGDPQPGLRDLWDAVIQTYLEAGKALPPPEILFRKVEDEEIQVEIDKLRQLVEKPISAEPAPMACAPLKPAITIEDVQKLDLRIGVILSAEPVPKSKKLLKLQVDLGFEKRTIVSGISLYYTPEQLIGQKVVVVANLVPATLMGVQSQGMVLAGKGGETLELVSVTGLPVGSDVS